MKKLFLIFILSSIFAISSFSKGMPSEYYEIKTVKESKKYFFEYIYKLIENENLKILNERKFVKNILSSNILNINMNSKEFAKLLEIKKRYRIKKIYDLNEYMRKIDIVPPSMALAQAAVESGWGKSRFIKEANNIFGHWTYNPEIGMIPKQRDEGANHFIRIFKTLQDSISAYILNLNRNRAYKLYQNTRLEERKNNKNPSGLVLSNTMINYSGIGEEYLMILEDMIVKNKLTNYDKRFYQKLNTKK